METNLHTALYPDLGPCHECLALQHCRSEATTAEALKLTWRIALQAKIKAMQP